MKLFNWYRSNRITINGILITIITSLVFNVISGIQDHVFDSMWPIVLQLIEVRTPGGLLMWTSVALLAVTNLWYWWKSKRLEKKAYLNDFVTLMKQYTSPTIVDSVGNGCISWGEGKTIQICNDIMFGWKSENILVSDYRNEMYQFYQEDDQLKKHGQKSYYFNTEDYLQFKNSENFRTIIRNGNNLPRFMLTKATTNFDKNQRKLLLSLQRTEWSQTSYIWDGFGKKSGKEIASGDLMKEYAKGISTGNESEPYLPNSLCLHLIIETIDGKVILARISQTKMNDNPGTWAATLGEQLDLADFLDGNNYNEQFVNGWVRRAFREEYKLDDNAYEDLVNEDSIRILSVDFESDRYNFALCCVVTLRYTFETFYRKTGSKLAADEAIELRCIAVEDIPGILKAYGDPIQRKEYHPSTYLRLLMLYLSKNGYSRAEKKIIRKLK